MIFENLVLFTLLVGYSSCQSYKAAVYEHNPSTAGDPQEIIIKNLEFYRKKLEDLKTGNERIDIIVFPEYGLTGMVKDPDQYASKIDNSSSTELLRELKDMAIEHYVYIVLNLLEKVVNDKKKTYYYNTNVVFDRKGEIIAKYRKINLNNEPKLTAGNETVSFQTDFNVKFGVLTSYDLLFNNPSRTILNDKTITDIVFPSAWASVTPFYNGLSVQHGYAHANGVNLLAANLQDPAHGLGGSGIFTGNGKILETFIDGFPGSRIVIQDVTKIPARIPKSSCIKALNVPEITPFGFPSDGPKINITSFITSKDFSQSKYKFEDIDLSKNVVGSYICQGKMCCTFNATIEQPSNSNEIYKFMVFDGTAGQGGKNEHLRLCSLVACKNNMPETCGERINGTTHFLSLSVQTSNIPFDPLTTFYQPISLNYALRPFDSTNYCELLNVNSTNIEFVAKDKSQVLAFGIYGKTSGAGAFQGVGLIVFLSLLSSYLLVRP